MPTPGLSSGLSEILGNDLVISLGCGFTGTAGSNDEQAGTLMHELGHNFNLGHGGTVAAPQSPSGTSQSGVNCKPNYLSVMNYARQMPSSGLFDQTSWESGFNYGASSGARTALDYSRFGSPTHIFPATYTGGSAYTVPDLTESLALSEVVGLTSSDGKSSSIVYGTPTAAAGSTAHKVVTPPAAINWNNDADSIDTGVSQDVNKLITNTGVSVPGCNTDTPGQVLKSYNDWVNLNLVFLPNAQSQRGTTLPQSTAAQEREAPPVFYQALSIENKQVEFIPPPNLDGTKQLQRRTGNTSEIPPAR